MNVMVLSRVPIPCANGVRIRFGRFVCLGPRRSKTVNKIRISHDVPSPQGQIQESGDLGFRVGHVLRRCTHLWVPACRSDPHPRCARYRRPTAVDGSVGSTVVRGTGRPHRVTATIRLTKMSSARIGLRNATMRFLLKRARCNPGRAGKTLPSRRECGRRS